MLAPTRIWQNNASTDDSVHCLSNGKLCAYSMGPQLIQVFGPPFSSPSLYQLDLDLPIPVRCTSQRQTGSAIWEHHLEIDNQPAADLLDFVDSQLSCLVRRIRTTTPLRFTLKAHVPFRWVENAQSLHVPANGGLLLETPAGQHLYHNYPFPNPIFHQIAWHGEVTLRINPQDNSAELIAAPGEDYAYGESVLYLCGGPSYPEAVQTAEAALAKPVEDLLSSTQAWWQGFTSRRHSLDALPADLPLRAEVIRAADDVAVLIKAQQAQEGGVLAGYNYHLGYVRDQYGVSRGLLALGLHDEARKILSFYWGVWQRHGRIHNAQTMGVDGVFHIHENDQVEITGYLIRQAFDLLAATGDGDFCRTIFPMLEWAWNAQKANLVDDMLPFNGDETYVAGGVLPRYTLNHGSAEATHMFIDSGEKLLKWVERENIWSADRLSSERAILERVRSHFRRNFWHNGKLATNNPSREARAELPRFRHGVCERCLVEPCRPVGAMWTERDPHGRYLCPECLAKGSFYPAEEKTFFLQSVSLTPFYFHSSLFQPEELAGQVVDIASAFQKTGKLPSRPDDSAGVSVGYDYGFLLYALTSLKHPLAHLLYEKTLGLLDSTGAWSEYYLAGVPRGTRCRPWESAINLEAALRWAEQA